MRCLECGSTYTKHTGSVTLYDSFIGNYHVFDVEYYKCDSCKNLLFPKETAIKIEKAEQERREYLIKRLPLVEFIFASEAAEILNISRQALHKHRRIRLGFIYSITFGGKKVYHKKSVILFKEQDDGRFPLTNEVSISSPCYLSPELTNQQKPDYTTGITPNLYIFPPYKQPQTKLAKYRFH